MPESLSNPRPASDLGPSWTADQAGARLLVVSGGRTSVGATTLAVRIARELAHDAQRIVLIDANVTQPSIASRFELVGGMNVADVLAGRKTIHEALQRGPEGMQILAGSAADTKSCLDERCLARLLKQLRSLAPHADWIVADAGHEASELVARLWTAASDLLLVTTADAAAVMDTYALVKTFHARRALRKAPELVVNNVVDESIAADVHRRIDQSCLRFLGLSLAFAGCVPSDAALPAAELDSASPLAGGIARLCKHLALARHSAARPPLAA